MILYLKADTERNSRPATKGGDEFLNVELSVKGRRIGEVELEKLRSDDEWLLKFRSDAERDWKIIAQGEI